MPTLNWIGKDAVVRHHKEVAYRLLGPVMWFYFEVGHTQEAKKELIGIVEFATSEEVFITPKPTRLIQRILQIATDNDSLVLDSFAGSGTTGHAVLKQNLEDGGKRRFILVEMDADIARNVIAERVRRVAQGYARASTGSARTGVDSSPPSHSTKASLFATDSPSVRPEPVEGPPPSVGVVAGPTWVEDLGSGFQFWRLSAEPSFTRRPDSPRCELRPTRRVRLVRRDRDRQYRCGRRSDRRTKMNPRSLDLCLDPGLRLSRPAMQRAARRAWDIAHQTNTCIVVGAFDGVRHIAPNEFDRLAASLSATPTSATVPRVDEDTVGYLLAPNVADE